MAGEQEEKEREEEEVVEELCLLGAAAGRFDRPSVRPSVGGEGREREVYPYGSARTEAGRLAAHARGRPGRRFALRHAAVPGADGAGRGGMRDGMGWIGLGGLEPLFQMVGPALSCCRGQVCWFVAAAMAGCQASGC
ncbi:hypothetical protein PLESTF_000063600 [Pleodorina starrii]|nr:hypothetical protein PLESTF_000063600 [Pleodorina starrii]